MYEGFRREREREFRTEIEKLGYRFLRCVCVRERERDRQTDGE